MISFCFLRLAPKLSNKVREFLLDQSVIKDFDKELAKSVVDRIEENDWLTAKWIWTVEILKLVPNNKYVIDTFANSFDSFGRIIAQQQVFMRTTKCVCRGGLVDDRETELNQLYFNRDENNSLTHTFSHGSKCPACCQTMIHRGGQFLSTPAWLFFDVNYTDNMVKLNCYEAPLSIRLNELTFKLLCCQIKMSHMAHFKGIFLIEDTFYMLDDLNSQKKPSVPVDHRVTSLLYYSSE
jgi:hypothetical protein